MSLKTISDVKHKRVSLISGKQFLRVSHSIDALYRQVFKDSPFLDEILSAIGAIPLQMSSPTMTLQFLDAERGLRHLSILQEVGFIGNHQCYQMSNRDVYIYSGKYDLYFSLSAIYFQYLQTQSYLTVDIVASMSFGTKIRVSQVDIGAEQLKSYMYALAILGEILEVPKYSKKEIRKRVDDCVIAVFGKGYESGYYSAGDQLHDIHVYPLVYSDTIKENTNKIPISQVNSFSIASLRSAKPWMSSFSGDLKTESQWYAEEHPVVVNPVQEVFYPDIEVMEYESGSDDDYGYVFPEYDDTDTDNIFDFEEEILDTTCGLVEEELEKQVSELNKVEEVLMVDPTNLATDTQVREGFIIPEYYKSDPSYNAIILSKVNYDRHIVFLDAIQKDATENMLEEYAKTLTYKGQAKWVVYACARNGSIIRRVRVY